MKAKDYMKPTTQVVKLQHTKMLMTSTEGVGAKRSSYGTASDEYEQTWD